MVFRPLTFENYSGTFHVIAAIDDSSWIGYRSPLRAAFSVLDVHGLGAANRRRLTVGAIR